MLKARFPAAPGWIWLFVGAILSSAIMAQTTLWFAPWLAPVLLLRFTRTTPAKAAFPSFWIALTIAAYISFRGGFMPYDGVLRHLTIGGIALAYVLAYATDKALWRKYSGVTSTLIFPLASTSIGFLATVGNPLGTAGSEASSQEHLALLQLVAITGIWGLVFLMSWLAAVVNALWEQGWNLRREWRTAAAFGMIVSVVLAAGSVRLTFFAPATESVRVAAIVTDRELSLLAKGRRLATRQQRDASRSLLDPLLDDLIQRTEREARAGAKIVVWSEGAARILEEDEPEFLNRMKALASRAAVYVQVGANFYSEPSRSVTAENRAIMFTPDGEIAWDYHKVHVTPGDPEKPGDYGMPFVDTQYGRIATIICQDDLFPDFVRGAGRNDVDLLLVPSNDWSAVAKWHWKITVFRAIENGVSIVRPTSQGISTAVDPLGRIIARRSDYFVASGDHTLIASVPTSSTPTPYRLLGNAVAFASVLFLSGLGAHSILGRRFARPHRSGHGRAGKVSGTRPFS